METNKKEAIKKAIFIFVLLILIIIVGFITVKYEIEGEQNPPFAISKIRIISTADAIEAEENQVDILQVNDIYISIEKNENYKQEELIRRLGIENIKITKQPQKGKNTLYRPSDNEKITYIYDEKFKIENNIEYFGDKYTDLKELSIANQGGTISFRSCIKNLGKISKEEVNKLVEETQNTEIAEGTTLGINHNSGLLQKAGINEEEIKYEIQFDLILELETNKKYKATVMLDLPNEELEGETVKGKEIENPENIIFKRTKI